MSHQKKLTSLSDLNQLLPDLEQQKLTEAKKKQSHHGKGKSVRISLEKKGRKGKTVTIVSGLQHNPMTIEEISRLLKQHCGAGGTVKDGHIEIQGDHRIRVAEKLKEMNYNPC